MERIPQTPPLIKPVADSTHRPLWSVMIPVYNCSAFLPAALASVLAQDPGQDFMQIEVVDDCSTDADVEALVNEIGKGRVRYFRQPQNVGSLRNFETCLNRARGHLVHLLHGDDTVKPGFYAKIKSLFDTYPEAGAAFTRYAFINSAGDTTHFPPPEASKDGILHNWLLRIAERQRTQYAATVVKREVYEKLGGFYGMSYAEDWEMWVRIAKQYPVAYSPDVLAEYRVHANSISSIKITNDNALTDYLHAIHFIQGHLSESQRKQILKRSVRDCAFFKINKANLILKESNNRRLILNELKQAFRFSTHPDVLFQAFKVCVKMTIGLR